MTLNTENPGEFRRSLSPAIFDIELSESREHEKTDNSELSKLILYLKRLLKNRPGWLLIVDNIRDAKHYTEGHVQGTSNPRNRGMGNWKDANNDTIPSRV